MIPARQDTPLKEILRQEGRRHAWLAEQVDADRAEMSRWVNGVHIPRLETQERIASVLGRSVDELWPTEAARAA